MFIEKNELSKCQRDKFKKEIRCWEEKLNWKNLNKKCRRGKLVKYKFSKN